MNCNIIFHFVELQSELLINKNIGLNYMNYLYKLRIYHRYYRDTMVFYVLFSRLILVLHILNNEYKICSKHLLYLIQYIYTSWSTIVGI